MFGFPGSQVPTPEGSQVPTRETERIRCPRVGGSHPGLYPAKRSRAEPVDKAMRKRGHRSRSQTDTGWLMIIGSLDRSRT